MQKIALNIVPSGIYPKIYVNQYDLGRQFQITFKEGTQDYNFPSNATFKINGHKPDGHVFEYTQDDTWDGSNYIITKSGSGTSLTVTISTTEQMTAAPGDCLVQLTYKVSNAVTGTLNFIMAVQERPESSGDPSESDVPDVVRFVNGVAPDANGDVTVPGTGSAVTKNFAALEATRTMTTTRSAGSYVYVSSDDQFYLITATISANGTLIPGTNATAVTVGDVLQMLNSDLASLIAYEDYDFMVDTFSGATVGALISAKNTTTDVSKTGYTPIGVTLTNFDTEAYNVEVLLIGNNVYTRFYAAKTASSNQAQCAFRVMYIKT